MSSSSIAAGRTKPAGWTRPATRIRAGLAALAATALLGAAVAPAAGAETGAESLYGPSMKLAFARPSAELIGSGAVIDVKCKGPRGGTCTGTVSLRFGARTHKAPFSIAGGRRQSLLVPLGGDRALVGSHRLRALARTAQPLGSCRESRRLLRVR